MALTQSLLDPANHAILSIIKGARNGLVYGAKIRFPHALVMVTLFGSGTPRDKWKKIITATRQHAMRLALYVMIYKTTLMVIRDLFRDGKQASIDPFLAGMLGGWYMFGERTPVNEQIVLYCVSRCVAALLPRARVPKDYPTNKVVPIDNTAHQLFAALTWGSVMWLFVNKRHRLNGGLVSSMDCVYSKRETNEQTCTFFPTSGTVSETLYGTMYRECKCASGWPNRVSEFILSFRTLAYMRTVWACEYTRQGKEDRRVWTGSGSNTWWEAACRAKGGRDTKRMAHLTDMLTHHRNIFIGTYLHLSLIHI